MRLGHPRVKSTRKIRICKPIYVTVWNISHSMIELYYSDFFATIFGTIISGFTSCSVFLGIFICATLLPMVAAMPEEHGFPDLTFKAFNEFIKANFSSKVSLATVLLVLFTMTENPDLLNLHARQKNPSCPGEYKVKASGWIKALASALQNRLADKQGMLFKSEERQNKPNHELITPLALKLDAMADLLNLSSYDDTGRYKGKLRPVSHAAIKPVFIICPISPTCITESCNPRGLQQATKARDIPLVTLIKGTTIHHNVPVLTGKCPSCQTSYFADHERFSTGAENDWQRTYLNSAKYLKVGQTVWVDRIFSNSVLNGMYSFHASASAYMEFWNNSFGTVNAQCSVKITRRQIWQAFVQESIRTISATSGLNLELKDGLPINDVTTEAFSVLGEAGMIRAADKHTCSECTQEYKAKADLIINEDPAAIVGVDENQRVPQLAEEHIPQISVEDTDTSIRSPSADEMDVDHAPVKMVVVDGIVMGTTVSVLKFLKNISKSKFSIVHMMIALLILLMHVVEHFVHTMKLCMVLNVVSEAVLTTKLILPRPVNNINENGKNMYKIIVRLA